VKPPPLSLLAVILAGFVAVGLLLFRAHSFPLASEQDGVGYLAQATAPALSVHAFHGPGYPAAIRAVMGLGLDPFPAAKLVSLVSGVLFVAATWRLAASILSPEEALVAATITAFAPIVLTSSVTIMSDLMGAALFVAAVATLLAAPAAPWAGILGGALAGLAYLTRDVYLIALALPLLLWLGGVPAPDRRLRRLAASLALFAGAFVVVALPWMAIVYAERGSPVWNQHYLNVAFKMYRAEQGQNAYPRADEFAGWWDVVRLDPLRVVRGWAWTALGFPSRTLGLVVGGAMLGAAGFLTWLARFDGRKAVLLGVTALYGAVVSLTVPRDRYLLAGLPLAACLVASGLGAIPAGIRAAGSAGRRLDRVPLEAGVTALTLAVLFSQDIRESRSWFADETLEYRAAAEQLARRAPAGASMLSGPRHLAFFSGTRWVGFLDGRVRLQEVGLAELPDRLARIRPTYLAFDERYAAARFPRLRDLLDPRLNPYPGMLRPVVVVDAPKRVVIYEYLP
jgi:hypothetical protein